MGYPTAYDGYTASWENGKLTKLSKGTLATGKTTYSYTYNALGQRTKRSYSHPVLLQGGTAVVLGELTGSQTTFAYDASGRLIAENTHCTYYMEEDDDHKVVYLYDDSGVIGMVYTYNGSAQTFYFRKNLLGDILAIYNTNGNKVVGYNYDAFGNCDISSDTTSFNVANANSFRYRGYYYDSDIGLYYLNSRYYSPVWHRFISPDKASAINSDAVNGLNLYTYCYNDPVNCKQKPVFSGDSAVDSSISSASNGGIFSSGSISSGSVDSSRVNWGNGGFQIPIWISSLMSGLDFGTSIASPLQTIYQYIRYPGVKDLNKLYGLDFVPGKLNTVCSVIGYGLLGLNVVLSAWSNFTNDNLTAKQKWIGFGVDTAYTLGTFGIGYGVGALVSLIPGVGVFIAPFVSAGVAWFIDWTNEKWGWLDDVKQWFNDL